jgi:hypothetical protein
MTSKRKLLEPIHPGEIYLHLEQRLLLILMWPPV